MHTVPELAPGESPKSAWRPPRSSPHRPSTTAADTRSAARSPPSATRCAPPARIYFAGDTDLFDEMADLAGVDVALLPIAGWGPKVGRGTSIPSGHWKPHPGSGPRRHPDPLGHPPPRRPPQPSPRAALESRRQARRRAGKAPRRRGPRPATGRDLRTRPLAGRHAAAAVARNCFRPIGRACDPQDDKPRKGRKRCHRTATRWTGP